MARIKGLRGQREKIKNGPTVDKRFKDEGGEAIHH